MKIASNYRLGRVVEFAAWPVLVVGRAGVNFPPDCSNIAVFVVCSHCQSLSWALSEENFCYFENVSELMIRMEKIVVNQRHHDS